MRCRRAIGLAAILSCAAAACASQPSGGASDGGAAVGSGPAGSAASSGSGAASTGGAVGSSGGASSSGGSAAGSSGSPGGSGAGSSSGAISGSGSSGSSGSSSGSVGSSDAGTDSGARIDASADSGPDARADGGIGDAGTLRTAAARTGLLIGTAYNTQHATESAYTTTAATQFDYVTPENEMKWDATEPSSGTFTFAAGDAVVSFAQKNGMKVKGHNLVWFRQLPSWVTSLSGASAVQQAMVDHITQVATHYKGQVVAWDVVNEAWNDDGASLRNDVFDQFLGSSYIDLAFQTARAADPGALLYYNDFGTEGMSPKANAVFTMLESMVSRGIPIDGVGMQMHTTTTTGPTLADFVANMQRIAALGLQIVISEFDVELCSGTQAAQQARFHDIVAACLAQPACKAVTVWGVTDKFSWLNGVHCASPIPLLFDDNYVAKPAFTGVLDALNGL